MATRAELIPKARHIESRPCWSSESSCSEIDVMKVLNRMSLHDRLKRSIRLLRDAGDTRIESRNEGVRLGLVREKLVEDVVRANKAGLRSRERFQPYWLSAKFSPPSWPSLSAKDCGV